jgi:hypothetical protein
LRKTDRNIAAILVRVTTRRQQTSYWICDLQIEVAAARAAYFTKRRNIGADDTGATLQGLNYRQSKTFHFRRSEQQFAAAIEPREFCIGYTLHKQDAAFQPEFCDAAKD